MGPDLTHCKRSHQIKAVIQSNVESCWDLKPLLQNKSVHVSDQGWSGVQQHNRLLEEWGRCFELQLDWDVQMLEETFRDNWTTVSGKFLTLWATTERMEKGELCAVRNIVSRRFTLTNVDFMPDFLQISKAQTAKGEKKGLFYLLTAGITK